MSDDGAITRLLRFIEGCEAHGHVPTEIHVRRSEMEALFHDANAHRWTHKTLDQDEIKEAADDLGKWLDEGGLMFGVQLIPEPNARQMWAHGDGLFG